MTGLALPYLMNEIVDEDLQFAKYTNFLLALQARRRRDIRVQSRPFDLSINPSTACQLACPQCETGNGKMTRPATNMSAATHRQMLAGQVDHLFVIRYFGTGETLLNKKFPALMEEIRGKEIFTFITTNLSFKFTDQQIDELLQSGLNILGVSLDGITQETYTRYRVGGEYALVLDNMKRLLKRREELGQKYPLIEWRYLVFKHNEHEVDEVRRMARELKVDILEFAQGYAPEDGSGTVAMVDEFNVSPNVSGLAVESAMAEKRTRLAKLMRRVSPQQLQPPQLLKFTKCDWHYFGSYWYPDGGVGPCCVATDISEDFGRVNQLAEFADVWNGDLYRDARALFTDDESSSSFCRECRGKSSMDRFFITSMRGALINAPEWVLKIISQDLDQFFEPIDYYFLYREIEALKRFSRSFRGDHCASIERFERACRSNIVQEQQLGPLLDLLRCDEIAPGAWGVLETQLSAGRLRGVLRQTRDYTRHRLHRLAS